MPQRLDSAKQAAIRSWIITALGINAIWTGQNELRPILPYASINIIAGPVPDGTPQKKYKTTNTFTYLFRSMITLSVQVFSNTNHLALLRKLINSLTLPSHRQLLRAAGLSVYNDTSISPIDISALINTGIEKRGSIDITMAYADEVDDLSGEIVKMQLKGEAGSKFEDIDTTIDSTV